MKINRFGMLIILLGVTCLALPQRLALAEAHGGGAVDGYEVNPGDVMIITVWKEEDLQRQVLVLPDGMISFPLAGDINAAGKSIAEIRNEQGLGRWLYSGPDSSCGTVIAASG